MNKIYLIAGCGVSGKAAARLASRMRLNYVLCDEQDTPELRKFAQSLPYPPSSVHFGFNVASPEELPPFDMCVLSPGIRRTGAFFKHLASFKPDFTGELEFAYSFLKVPLLGITGTNGKTTTTELLTAILNADGIASSAAGNIGAGICDAACDAMDGKVSALAVEISSFQLEGCRDFKVSSGAILNLASDHIDRHGSMEKYAELKFSLVKNLPPERRILNVNLKDWASRFLGKGGYATFSAHSADADFILRENGMLSMRGRDVLDFNRLKLKGRHNAENVLAALALASTLDGFSVTEHVIRALEDFTPDLHRMELFLEKDGVKFVNDSKATNPHSVNAALECFGAERNIVILLGGLDKDMDFSEILVNRTKIRRAFLFGRCSGRIYSSLHNDIECVECGAFSEAVKAAYACVRSGETLLFSPATASMDEFRNYRERGECFKRLICELAKV